MSDFLWRASSPVFLAGGAAIVLVGVLRSLPRHAAGSSDAAANLPKTSFTYLIIGVALAILGISLNRMYRHRQGQIDSVFLKQLKRKKG